MYICVHKDLKKYFQSVLVKSTDVKPMGWGKKITAQVNTCSSRGTYRRGEDASKSSQVSAIESAKGKTKEHSDCQQPREALGTRVTVESLDVEPKTWDWKMRAPNSASHFSGRTQLVLAVPVSSVWVPYRQPVMLSLWLDQELVYRIFFLR